MRLPSPISGVSQRLLPRDAVPLARAGARLRRRHLLIPCIIIVELGLLVLIFVSPRAVEELPAATPPISTFDVRATAEAPVEPAADPQPAPPPEPVRLKQPTPVIDLQLEAATLPVQPIISALAGARAGFGTTCDVANTLARAFAENEFIQGELARIGPQSRSVSNAIMFWDTRWVELPGDAPKEAVETLRRAVLEGVRAAPAECLTQELAGPRFIFVGDTSPAAMLVLGSGTWRWEQLLDEAEDVPEAAPPIQQGR